MDMREQLARTLRPRAFDMEGVDPEDSERITVKHTLQRIALQDADKILAEFDVFPVDEVDESLKKAHAEGYAAGLEYAQVRWLP